MRLPTAHQKTIERLSHISSARETSINRLDRYFLIINQRKTTTTTLYSIKPDTININLTYWLYKQLNNSHLEHRHLLRHFARISTDEVIRIAITDDKLLRAPSFGGNKTREPITPDIHSGTDFAGFPVREGNWPVNTICAYSFVSPTPASIKLPACQGQVAS